ncbi:VOC family protein [Roseomonas marmotae]|uniref:VOC family protein n=1 Tax=Roseomonas marmotae TaxID=2768161 RepID=A0ABS3KHX5_9PROT|nr:VOC family protein [Roseomonas marmotae]MBO1076218.1 VOC family protein [Roseomonas marmotae]QTI81994.1 VOC family protein [Roseomonas marmotae]
MASFRFDHIHLRSADPEAAAAFYVDNLRATIRDRVRNGAALRVIVDLGGVSLFIEEVPPTTPAAPVPPHQGIEHIGLQVTDMDEAVAAMKARGVRFTMEPKELRPGLRIAFLAAPDGVSVEILQRG